MQILNLSEKRKRKQDAGPGMGQHLLWCPWAECRLSSQGRCSSTGTQHGVGLIPRALSKAAAQILLDFIVIYGYLLSIISKPGTVLAHIRSNKFTQKKIQKSVTFWSLTVCSELEVRSQRLKSKYILPAILQFPFLQNILKYS